MKRISMTFVTVMVIIMTSCEKEDIKPSKPDHKDNLKECLRCGGSWDITDPTDS